METTSYILIGTKVLNAQKVSLKYVISILEFWSAIVFLDIEKCVLKDFNTIFMSYSCLIGNIKIVSYLLFQQKYWNKQYLKGFFIINIILSRGEICVANFILLLPCCNEIKFIIVSSIHRYCKYSKGISNDTK